jgi:hypothetical protein
MHKYHICKDGTIMRISEMSDEHLTNTIRMIECKAKEGARIAFAIFDPFGSDHYYEEFVVFGAEALQALHYWDYIEELRGRGLKIND